MGTLTLVTTTIAAPSQGKIRVEAVAQTPPGGTVGMIQAGATNTIVDNGTTMYLYRPALKSYSTMPHIPRRAGLMGIPGMSLPPNTTLKQTGTATIDGHVVLVAVASAPGMPPAFNMVMSLDKQTGQPRKVVITSHEADKPGMPANRTTIVTMHMVSEEFDHPLPAGVFTFIPPRGVTLRGLGSSGARQRPGPVHR